MLYHVSEQADIARFEPRPSELVDSAVVWAINDARLCNYLLPRDCPRVTFYAGPQTTADDARRFLQGAAAVVIIEHGWLERVQNCRLCCYHLPPDRFELLDECAGYYVSRVSVTPTRIDVIDDVVSALQQRGVALRTVDSLWTFRDAVVASSLQFSIIRLRNARPREDVPCS